MLLNKSLINTLKLATLMLVVSACVPKATEKKAVCGENEAFSTVTRSCYSIEEQRYKPVGTKSSDALAEETPKTIILTYTDANKDQAISCKVSAISSNVEAISPLLLNNGLTNKAADVYSAFYNLANSIPVPDTATAATYRTNMLDALTIMRTSFSQASIDSAMTVFLSYATNLLTLATNHPGEANVQNFYALGQTMLQEFAPFKTQVNNRCECSAGVCTTTISPKLHKSGSAGFSYTITDVDGESETKAVSLTITPMSTASTHLQPVAKSLNVTGAESNTSTATGINFTIPAAGDINSTASANFQYTFVSASKGTVTNCMNLTGSTAGKYDTTCTYTPTNGDAYTTSSPAAATVSIPNAGANPAVFTAVANGSYANNKISIEYVDLQDSNSPFSRSQAFGLVSSYQDSFVRVNGDAITVYINLGITSTLKVVELINNHPQANKLVVASGGSASDNATPTSGAVYLTGGVDAFDTITYRVSNGISSSTNTGTIQVNVTSTNDLPMVARDYLGSPYSHTEIFNEETVGHSIIVSFKDVDSYASQMTISAVVNETLLASTTCPAMTTADMPFISPNSKVHANVPAPAVATCAVDGTCTATITVDADLDFYGDVCLYYSVADSLGASSVNAQGVKLSITGVNDAPLLSNAALAPNSPSDTVVTPLSAMSIDEDLAGASVSYKNIYVRPSGSSYEASQLTTVSLLSSAPTLIPNVACLNYRPGTATPVGSVIPSGVGALYFDITNLRCYIATGTGTSNWKLYPSLTAYPANCNIDVTDSTSYGTAAPTGTPSAANKYYLNTSNNKCYKSSATSWALDPAMTNYKISYIPATDKSGSSTITVTVQDNGGATAPSIDTTTGTFVLTVNSVDDPPVFRSFFTSIQTNEGGDVQTEGFLVDEDDGATTDEDLQPMSVSAITTDNASVLPVSSISIFYDLNDNGVEDAGESRAIGAMLEASAADDASLHKIYLKLDPVDGVSGNANISVTISDGTSAVTKSFAFIVHPIAALHGGWNNISSVGLKTNKSGAPVAATDISCEYNVTTDKNNCSSSNVLKDCKGSASPNGSIVPSAKNTIYWDETNLRCYRSTGATEFTWVDHNTSCPITKAIAVTTVDVAITSSGTVLNVVSTAGFPEAGTITVDTEQMTYTAKTSTSFTGLVRAANATTAAAHSIGAKITAKNAAPFIKDLAADPAPTPTAANQFYYTVEDKTCRQSVYSGTNLVWDTTLYQPSKVTLAWKPFTVVGSGPESGVQIAGWNVYRREHGADFNFKGGHLKNTSSTSVFTIADPSVRTFTDTTAVAGKVYFYVVRPVENRRNFPTYTPEIFSEVRVMAAPSNYTFVHRWIVNQEICNGMNITTSTSPNYVDTSNNFRCPYIGPGTSSGYYDYGRDLLVDTQELGCPYAAAPACTANGCVGIGAPTYNAAAVGHEVAANGLYYDRGTGTCYRSAGATTWETVEATAVASIANILNSALNAPLVNVTQAKAAVICSARTAPTVPTVKNAANAIVPGMTFGAVSLPDKKDYMGYASHKLNITDPEITEMEQGFSLNVTSRCNGSAASGLETAYTDSAIPSTSFIYSLPGTASSGIKSLYTGSIAWASSKGTEACVSRFGIQDLYGNVAEWTKDQMDCSSPYVCTPVTGSSYEAYNFDGAGTPYALDLKSGPYNDADGSGTTAGTDAWLTQWTFSDQLFGATKFSFPLALPINGDIDSMTAYEDSAALPWILNIGPSSGITTNKLHEDGIIINGAAVNLGATHVGSFAVGGSYRSGNLSGRFTSELVPEADKRPDIGMRCIIPVSGYASDAKHTYPY